MRFTILHAFSEFPNCFRVNPRRLVLMLLVLVFSLTLIVARSGGSLAGQVAVGQPAVGTITGTVFQDYNANGTRETSTNIANAGSGNISVAVDSGISGVVVTAYAASGAVAGTAATDEQGAFSLNASGDAPYRVEFTNLPDGFKPGPFGQDSGTSVQFVSSNNANNVSLGLLVPGEYCQNNPALVTGCYVGGDQNTDSPGMITFPYASGRWPLQ
jgi:hypothetical protein